MATGPLLPQAPAVSYPPSEPIGPAITLPPGATPPPPRGVVAGAVPQEPAPLAFSPASQPWATTAPVAAGSLAAGSVAGASSVDRQVGEALVEAEGLDEEPAAWFSSRAFVCSMASMLFHLAAMILLALWVVPPLLFEDGPLVDLTMITEINEPEEVRKFRTEFLDESLRPAISLTEAGTYSPTRGSEAGFPDAVSEPQLESDLLEEDLYGMKIALDRQTSLAPGQNELLTELPHGAAGEARAVVDNYQQAMDRITQEILQMMEKKKVLVVWCFDQSESMKDDQEEIRARIDRVYAELDLTHATDGDALTTAVTSFGNEFAIHTPAPTDDLEELQAAIRAVPIDPSGEEMMCRAVMMSIAMYQEYAAAHDRQMALILVSDESGNLEENQRYLETTVRQAIAARCRVYVLGREAVFGYPYAHVRWVHPQTGREHLLPVDRGPETAFIEQLQTEGFERRTDAHPSGFGPYAQSRLAWQTGGIFFLLPSLESDLNRGQKRRYGLQAMEGYQPDLHSPAQVLMGIQRSPLRSLIWKIVSDLNPHQSDPAKLMDIRRRFAANKEEFARQVQEAETKARAYYEGLQRAVQALDAKQAARDREPSRRWQANYDLIRAQTVAYAAHVYVYRKALGEAAAKLETTPATLPNNERLVGWKAQQRKNVPLDETAVEMLQDAKERYLAVIENHPGTPWASRALWELRRDFDYPDAEALPGEERAGETAARPSPDALADNRPAGTGSTIRDAAGGAAGVDAAAGVDVGVDVGVGVGGGGGGGGGGGVGVGVDVAVAEGGAAWEVDAFPGFELVPEYRAPPKPPKQGGGGGKSRPPSRPKPSKPRPAPVPIPKL